MFWLLCLDHVIACIRADVNFCRNENLIKDNVNFTINHKFCNKFNYEFHKKNVNVHVAFYFVSLSLNQIKR